MNNPNCCLLSLAWGIFPEGMYFILWIACSLESLCTLFSCLTHSPCFKVCLFSIQYSLKYNLSDWQFIKREKCSFKKETLGKQNDLLSEQKHWWHHPVSQRNSLFTISWNENQNTHDRRMKREKLRYGHKQKQH